MNDYVLQYAKAMAGYSDDHAAFVRNNDAAGMDKVKPLVYADWLEEHDLPGAAAVVRSHAERRGGGPIHSYKSPDPSKPDVREPSVWIRPAHYAAGKYSVLYMDDHPDNPKRGHIYEHDDTDYPESRRLIEGMRGLAEYDAALDHLDRLERGNVGQH